MEGSFTAFTGPQLDWLVHSWVGNRKASLLDMNATVFLGQDTQVPHLIVIFGTIPKLFFYCDYVPRADLRVDLDYLQRYYEPANADYLRFRGNPAFTWSVSHGTYLRGLLSPVCSSYIMDLSDENIDTCERYLEASWVAGSSGSTRHRRCRRPIALPCRPTTSSCVNTATARIR